MLHFFKPCFLLFILVISGFSTADTMVDELEKSHFQVKSEGYHLDVEVRRAKNIKGKIPAVIFLVGSGAISTRENYEAFTKFFFDQALLAEGFALVYFDKRGLGKSEGIWYETNFEQRALDAKNVALAVSELEFIDPKRLFIVGHSQGGWIAQTALAQYSEVFAGGISMAGPTFPVRRQLVNDYVSQYFCNQDLDENKALKWAERKVKMDLLLASIVGFSGNLKQLKIIKDYDPKSYLESINKPLLLMFGENDSLVSPTWSLEALAGTFPNGMPETIEYYIAPDQEHSFKLLPMCFTGNWEEAEFSETTRKKLVGWLQKHNK